MTDFLTKDTRGLKEIQFFWIYLFAVEPEGRAQGEETEFRCSLIMSFSVPCSYMWHL